MYSLLLVSWIMYPTYFLVNTNYYLLANILFVLVLIYWIYSDWKKRHSYSYEPLILYPILLIPFWVLFAGLISLNVQLAPYELTGIIEYDLSSAVDEADNNITQRVPPRINFFVKPFIKIANYTSDKLWWKICDEYTKFIYFPILAYIFALGFYVRMKWDKRKKGL